MLVVVYAFCAWTMWRVAVSPWVGRLPFVGFGLTPFLYGVYCAHTKEIAMAVRKRYMQLWKSNGEDHDECLSCRELPEGYTAAYLLQLRHEVADAYGVEGGEGCFALIEGEETGDLPVKVEVLDSYDIPI